MIIIIFAKGLPNLYHSFIFFIFKHLILGDFAVNKPGEMASKFYPPQKFFFSKNNLFSLIRVFSSQNDLKEVSKREYLFAVDRSVYKELVENSIFDLFCFIEVY